MDQTETLNEAASSVLAAWDRLADWNDFDRDYLPNYLHTALERLRNAMKQVGPE